MDYTYKKYLDTRMKLSDGTTTKAIVKVRTVFDKNVFRCHCCQIAEFYGEEGLLLHVEGRMHEKNLKKVFFLKDGQYFPSKIDPSSLAYLKTKLNHKYLKYLKKPESHPSYKDEWESFWNRRYEELKYEGKVDPRNHDYRSEWIKFWPTRIEQLKRLEILTKTMTNNSDEDNDENDSEESSRTPRAYAYRNPSPETSSHESRKKKKKSRKRRKQRERKRRRSSSSDELSYENKSKKSQNESFTPPRTPLIEYCDLISSDDSLSPKPKQQEINFVSVFRLLSSFEQELGSLGPKCQDIFAKSIEAELSCPGKCNIIMMSNENQTLLVSVKEKLLGLIELEMLPEDRVKGVNTVIDRINTLIHKFPKLDCDIDIFDKLYPDGKSWTPPAEPVEKRSEIDLKDFSNADLLFLIQRCNQLEGNERDLFEKIMIMLKDKDPEREKLVLALYRLRSN